MCGHLDLVPQRSGTTESMPNFFSFSPPKGSSTYHVHYEKINHPCQDKKCEMALAAHQLHERQTDIAWHVEIDEIFFCYIQSSNFLS